GAEGSGGPAEAFSYSAFHPFREWLCASNGEGLVAVWNLDGVSAPGLFHRRSSGASGSGGGGEGEGYEEDAESWLEPGARKGSSGEPQLRAIPPFAIRQLTVSSPEVARVKLSPSTSSDRAEGESLPPLLPSPMSGGPPEEDTPLVGATVKACLFLPSEAALLVAYSVPGPDQSAPGQGQGKEQGRAGSR
ncbi:unnamed protein product, partial [Discosporangium mesarthrocarpum]